MKLYIPLFVLGFIVLFGCVTLGGEATQVSSMVEETKTNDSTIQIQEENNSFNESIDSDRFDSTETTDEITELTNSTTPNELVDQEVNKTALLEKLARSMLPTGIPEYGIKDNLSFDNPNHALTWFSSYDSSFSHWNLTESGHELYVATAGMISCEFCCGAKAIINEDGTVSCYCNHAAALRGAAKHMILTTNMTEDEIMEELIKWKTAWFPEPMIQKALDITLRNETVNISSLNIPTYIGGC